MIHYLAEIWMLLGLGPVIALNLTCVLIVLATAVIVFHLGRLYFGSWGGWLASAALLFAPYYHVNLYVRHAWAEFVAFPFLVFTLYGLERFALRGGRNS